MVSKAIVVSGNKAPDSKLSKETVTSPTGWISGFELWGEASELIFGGEAEGDGNEIDEIAFRPIFAACARSIVAGCAKANTSPTLGARGEFRRHLLWRAPLELVPA